MTNTGYCPLCCAEFTIESSQKIQCPLASRLTAPTHQQWIVFCPQCDLGILHPALSEKEKADLYEGSQFWGSVDTQPRIQNFAMPYTLAEARWNFIQTHGKNHPGKPIRLLDIGAGHGCLGMVAAKKLEHQLAEYVVVEPDPMMLNRLCQLWKYYGNCIPLKTFNSLSVVQGFYDVIILSHVLEHLENPASFLEETKKRLSPQGSLFIEVPNRDFRYKADVYGHVLFFGPVQLNKLLKNSGFRYTLVQGYGKNASKTPMNPSRNKLSQLIGKIAHKAKPILPYSLLSFYYRSTYGIDLHNPEGTWIRALARDDSKQIANFEETSG